MLLKPVLPQFLSNLFFDYNKFELKEKSISELDKIIRFLNENPRVRIEISGHTDNEGSAAYNLQLSPETCTVSLYLPDLPTVLNQPG